MSSRSTSLTSVITTLVNKIRTRDSLTLVCQIVGDLYATTRLPLTFDSREVITFASWV